MIKRLAVEYQMFAACSEDMRALLIANAIYALVLPILEIFVAAYLLRNSFEASHVIQYQAAVYIATPVAFFVNGYLLRVISLNHMYAAGMVLSGGALIVLMHADVRTGMDIAISGGLMGLATGIFWANRGFLALSVTREENRNYFYGVETTVMTVTSVLVPLAVGAWLGYVLRHGSHGGNVNGDYRIIAGFSFGLTLLAAAAMLRITYKSRPTRHFMYFRFDPLWMRLLVLTGLRGLTQGYMVTAPALLILRLVGQEGTLGTVEGVGSLVAAACLYLIGRVSKPHHRSTVLAAGLVIFLAGTLVNAWLYNSIGVVVFVGCLLLAKPLIEIAYYPIQLRVVDVVSHLEKRDPYAYIMNHEFGLLAGRLVGCALFLGIAYFMSERAALRYALAIVAILQIPAWFMAKRLQV